ncbi:dsRNA-specific ribonuclease [Thermoleptolyngbya sichuanensis A183]|uniref:DsRNA-specific ribonuclease n=1 Tax=Thermoleptolyngbya sichuanensis A183 TaxID=2737172 RepID=A0A6M8BID2_9CYAN|nr:MULTISPECIES: ribonuclease III domain-containing protein [Thermoleptolyngbya]QKD84657.1 dsRNA-specific ribonuclease [Thermoleptolyngbya sichuanensis A183]
MKLEDIAAIEQQLYYTFETKEFLIRALTRKAFAQEQIQQGVACQDQELDRILGDAILKAILVEMLIQQGCKSREAVTTEKSRLESRENLGKVLEAMKIQQFIRLGKGEKKQGIGNQSSVLGETFEALVAAIYLDSNSYEKTKELVIDLFSRTAAAASL